MNEPQDDLTDKVRAATELLESIADDRGVLVPVDPDLRQRLLIAAGQISRPDKYARRRFNRVARQRDKLVARANDEALLDRTGIRVQRDNPIFLTPRREALHAGQAPPSPGTVTDAKTCYVCRAEYRVLHHFYDQMCQACGDLNYAKRHQRADLTGRVALVTDSA